LIDIQKEIIKKFPNLQKKPNLIKNSIFKTAKKLIHEDNINIFLNQNKGLENFDFIDAVLDYFNFDFSYSNNDIINIPATGKVVIVANHPLGALDALCLLKLVSLVRKDVKIIANDFLAGFEPLENLFIKIDNYKSRQNKQNIQRVYDSLNNEEAVIIFPAGEVSRATPKGILDGKWHKGFLKFAKRTNSPILPVLVQGKNSKTFYTLSVLNKTFSTLLLSDEMFKKKDKQIVFKIGQIIPAQSTIPSGLEEGYIVNLYKKHLYALKKGKRKFFITQNPIAHPENRKELKKALQNSKLLGKTKDGKIIYLYSYEKDSIVLNELGRLREVSFRKVEEGVNQKRDLDNYDKYYLHIVLWDEDDLEIVGAYRIADTKYILENHGIKGLYTSTLFNFKEEFKPYLENSIELGRSFVQPKYWGSRALDYLWFGIGAYLRENPHIRYMFGPVSLSSSYPAVAKELITYFYSEYFGVKGIVEPKTPFIVKKDELKDEFLLNDYKKDFKKMKSILNDIGVAVPTLYKQYSELCEDGGIKFCGFNIDPDFSDCIDGFIIVDVQKVKTAQQKRYIHNNLN
jgi:putative hemolysin